MKPQKSSFIFSILSALLLTSCASGGEVMKSAGDFGNSVLSAIDEGIKKLPSESSTTGSGSNQRIKNVLPAELAGILAPEKKTSSNYPRAALAITKVDKMLWDPILLRGYNNGCMDITATVWTSATSSKPYDFKYCSPENELTGVDTNRVKYYWTVYKLGPLPEKAPRRGGRLGPEVPKTFWPNSQEDVRFLGHDYNIGVPEDFNSLVYGITGLMYHLDIDWSDDQDQRLWVSSIDKVHSAPLAVNEIPVYKTP